MLNRLLSTPYIDEKKVELYIERFKECGLFKKYTLDDWDGFNKELFGVTLYKLFNDDKVLFFPPDFVKILSDHAEELEDYILDKIYYNDNYDNEEGSEFYKLSIVQKIQEMAYTDDPYWRAVWSNYMKDRNICWLLEKYSGDPLFSWEGDPYEFEDRDRGFEQKSKR